MCLRLAVAVMVALFGSWVPIPMISGRTATETSISTSVNAEAKVKRSDDVLMLVAIQRRKDFVGAGVMSRPSCIGDGDGAIGHRRPAHNNPNGGGRLVFLRWRVEAN